MNAQVMLPVESLWAERHHKGKKGPDATKENMKRQPRTSRTDTEKGAEEPVARIVPIGHRFTANSVLNRSENVLSKHDTCGGASQPVLTASQSPRMDAISSSFSQFHVAFPLLNSFSRLCVAQIIFHSLSAALNPRRMNRPIPRASLICPKTGSTV